MTAAGQPDKPSVLYHYTTPEGLKGILQSGELWATEVRYLNDASELDYALQFARQELDEFLLEYPPSTSAQQKLAGQLRLALDSGEVKWREDFLCFVVCFCEEADLLSQWRGYGADGGYAIGLDVPAWEQARPDLRLRQVHYDEESYRQELNNGFRHLFAQDAHEIEAWADHRDLWDIYNRGEVYGAISFDAPFRKHPGFREEREWRISRLEKLGWFVRPGLRLTSDRRLIPYIELDPNIGEQEQTTLTRLPIREIRVGPMRQQELAVKALRLWLVDTLGYREAKVIPSVIPYRI